MNHHPLHSPFAARLAAIFVHLSIFAVGLQYAYYRIFPVFRSYDDEGTMMLRVWMLLRRTDAYDSLSGLYGPFYYLHTYAIHDWLGLPVTHDVNRLTTIVLWGLIALLVAMFVHRISRSLPVAAVVQMQLVLHLHTFTNEPGHPHEIALLTVAAALVSVTAGQGRGGMIALGMTVGALLLVKINLGIFLAIPAALTLLFFLPRGLAATALTWSAAIFATLLPAALMWRHLDTDWGRNYCAMAMLAILASIVACTRSTRRGEVSWQDVAATAAAGLATIAAVCAIILAWGNSPTDVANSVFLRAAGFSATLVVPAPIGKEIVNAGMVSLALSLGYAIAAPWISRNASLRFLLACSKLAYGVLAFHGLYQLGPGLLRQPIPVPFLWLLLARTSGRDPARSESLPLVFLALLAAFQTLQAYPIHGSQATWAVFLIAPLAALCIHDALRTMVEIGRAVLGTLGWDQYGRALPRWVSMSAATLVLVIAATFYHRTADIAGLKAHYERQTPLALPGAEHVRLLPGEVTPLRRLVESIKENCDGFVAYPGFGSLYFWTEMEPPAVMNGGWILNLEEDAQRVIIERMDDYSRPCVVQNMQMVGFWTGGRPADVRKPLVRHIVDQYRPGPQFGPYTLMFRTGNPDGTKAPLR